MVGLAVMEINIAIDSFAVSNVSNAISTTAPVIPLNMTPLRERTVPVVVNNNDILEPGLVVVQTDGVIRIARMGAFPGVFFDSAVNCGFYPITFTYFRDGF